MPFVKHTIIWKFTDEGDSQEAEFWLPAGVIAHKIVGSLINLVELSASEYGYAYDLKTECWKKDTDYIRDFPEGKERYEKDIEYSKTCDTCFWHDGDTCLSDEVADMEQ